MEPRIQYAKTEDGASIAYWTMGSGSSLVQMPSPERWQISARAVLGGLHHEYEWVAA